jgi:hypothetical protein
MVRTYSSGNIFMAAFFPEMRLASGKLASPPKVFVVGYDQEQAMLVSEQISWKSAELLAPDDMKVLIGLLNADRAKVPSD